MLVGDVKPLRLAGSRLPAMLSAGRPVPGTAMASNDAQVSARYFLRTRLSECRSPDCAPFDGVLVPTVRALW